MAGDLDWAGRGSGGPAGRAGVIQAVPGFLQGRAALLRGPGVHLQGRMDPAGLNVLIFR